MEKPNFQCVHYLNLSDVNEYLENEYDSDGSKLLDYIHDHLGLKNNGFVVVNLNDYEKYLETSEELDDLDYDSAIGWIEDFENEFSWDCEEVVFYVDFQ